MLGNVKFIPIELLLHLHQVAVANHTKYHDKISPLNYNYMKTYILTSI